MTEFSSRGIVAQPEFTPPSPEVTGGPVERLTQPQLIDTYNASLRLVYANTQEGSPTQQELDALKDPDSGFDEKNPDAKIKVVREKDPQGNPTKVEEIKFHDITKRVVDELEAISVQDQAADAADAQITQATEARRLLAEMDKSLVVEVKDDKESLTTRAGYKEKVKAARKQATDDAPQKYEKEKSVPMDEPPTPEQQAYIEKKAQEAEDQLEGKFGLKYQFEYNPAEVIDPENIMEIANQAIEGQIASLEEQIIGSEDIPKIVEWMGEIGKLRLAKMFDGKTALGAYGKYQTLKKYNTGEDRRTSFAVAKLAGYETEEGGKKVKVAGLLEGWEKGLDEIPGLVEYFKENGLEAFVSLAAISELHALSGNDATKLPEALDALRKKINLPQEVPLPVDMKEGGMDRLLFDNKTGLLDKLNQAIYGRTNVTLSEITAETRKGLSKQLIKKLKEHLKTMWGYTKSGTLILMLLALMMSSEGEQGGGQQQG